MKRQYRNQKGFSHHFILPLLAFVAVGAIGAYVISKSNAATAGPSDVIYQTYDHTTGNAYYRYSTATGQSKKYELGSEQIKDVSVDQKWVLVQNSDAEVAAVSASGQRISYGSFGKDPSGACSASTSTLWTSAFSKTSASSAPDVYIVTVDIPCTNGSYNYSYSGSTASRLYRVDLKGTKKLLLSVNATRRYGNGFFIASAGRNGNVLIQDSIGGMRYYVVSSAGKKLLATSRESASKWVGSVFMSEDGKKIVYNKGYSYPQKIYVADANGKNAKKLYSVSNDSRELVGISPTGSYIVYQKYLVRTSKTTQIQLYSFNVKTKKSVSLGKGGYYSPKPNTPSSGTWLPGSNTLVYSLPYDTSTTAQVVMINANGSGKKTLFSAPTDPGYSSLSLF